MISQPRKGGRHEQTLQFPRVPRASVDGCARPGTNDAGRAGQLVNPDGGHAVILVHDVNTGIHKALRERLLKFAGQMGLDVVFLPTPRGLAICQKRVPL